MSIPIPLGLAQPDAINHARVVQGIAQDRVLFTEQCLEESGIRVEAGAIENRVLRIQEVRDGSLEFFVEVLVPQINRTDAMPYPCVRTAWAAASTTAGWFARPR